MPRNISEIIETNRTNGQRVLWLIVLCVAGFFGLKYWHDALPFLLDIVYDTTKLIWGLAALVVSVLFLLHPKVHLFFSYALGSISNLILKEFVDIDSVGILRTYKHKTNARIKTSEDVIGGIRGLRDGLKKAIAKNESERAENMERARAAQKLLQSGGEKASQYKGALTLSGRQAQRLKRMNIKLEPQLARYEKWLAELEKMHDAALIMRDDLENEINAQIQEYEFTTQGYKGMKLFNSIMAKDGPERELVNDALNNLSSKCDDMLAKMDMMSDMSKGLVAGMDLDNMMFDEAALKDLEDWDRDHGGTAGLSTPPLTGVRVEQNVRIGTAEEASPDSFGSLFNDTQNKSGQP